MATFFSCPSSLILVLQLQLFFLLCITTAAPIEDICRKTKDPWRCIHILVTFEPRSTEAQLPELEEIAIKEATANARQVKQEAHHLFSWSTDPNLKRIYGDCENLYGGAVKALEGAQLYLKQRNYHKIVAEADTVGRAVDGCKAAKLKEDGEDVGVVGGAIRVIAQKLHATNVAVHVFA